MSRRPGRTGATSAQYPCSPDCSDGLPEVRYRLGGWGKPKRCPSQHCLGHQGQPGAPLRFAQPPHVMPKRNCGDDLERNPSRSFLHGPPPVPARTCLRRQRDRGPGRGPLEAQVAYSPARRRRTAFRDPAVVHHDGVFHVFPTYIRAEEEEKTCLYTAVTSSMNSNPRLLGLGATTRLWWPRIQGSRRRWKALLARPSSLGTPSYRDGSTLVTTNRTIVR